MEYKMSTYKIILAILAIQFFFIGCNSDDSSSSGQMDYRKEMREFVGVLSAYAKSFDSEFLIIPQNGQELVTDNGELNGILQEEYIVSIDATGREDLFYGYEEDDKATPNEDKQYLLDLCLLLEKTGIEVLVTDYCWTPEKIDNSYVLNEQYGFISFAAESRELNDIPAYPVRPFKENEGDIDRISKARNFLYLINGEKYNTKKDLLDAIVATNYDIIVMDLFQGDNAFNANEIARLKIKSNGGMRLVICYMSIGEAEDYRYYWNKSWRTDSPVWLESENPDWEGNFKVKYWEAEWQDIIFGSEGSYLDRILDTGFDGTYLDIVDGYEYFEEN
jgi:cysteinyl-tRNA synthetase, unknown class